MRALQSSRSAGELEVACAAPALKPAALPSNAAQDEAKEAGRSSQDKRKRSLSGTLASPPSKKQATSPMSEEKKVDPAVLQFQNQKLCQQLEVHKDRILDLESKLKGLEEKQTSYDANLITVNRIWGQLMEDLHILAVKASGSLNGSNGVTSSVEEKEDDVVGMEGGDLFLARLLRACPKIEEVEGGRDESLLDQALQARSAQTLKILSCVVSGIDQQRSRNEELSCAAKRQLADEEVLRAIETNESALREEVERTRVLMDDLHLRHRSLLAEVTLLRDVRLKQQAEMRGLQEQLEDTGAELDSCKRKLVALKQQLQEVSVNGSGNGVCGFMQTGPSRSSSKADLSNGDVSVLPKKELEALRGSLEEAQALASRRLKEIEDRHEEHLSLLKKVQELESALVDEQRVRSTRAYGLLESQLSCCRQEVERLRQVVETLQKERNASLVREKEMLVRAEMGDGSRKALALSENRVLDLETKLNCTRQEREELEVEVQRLQDITGRQETLEEMRKCVGLSHQKLGILQEQLVKFKALAEEVPALRAENKSLQSVLLRQVAVNEDNKAKHRAALEALKEQEQEIKRARKSEQELRLFVEMFSREAQDRRDVVELKQAEARALAQVEQLKQELEEHSLALRVRAANEAEAACQQRLAEAEAQVSRLMDELAGAERKHVELQEVIKSKVEEGEVYVSEVETISQAYEETQGQNQRLMEQISQREKDNREMMSENLKLRQRNEALVLEKAACEDRVRMVSSLAVADKERVQQLEGQVKNFKDQLEKVLEELRRSQAEWDAAKRQQGEAEKEAATLKRAALGLEEDVGVKEKRMAELEGELETQRHKVRRLEEDKEVLLSRVQNLERNEQSSSVAQQLEDLQDELKEYKSLVKCSVCHERKKEVVITKCFHLFCHPCIQRNLELRHRKCPGCGTPFGSADVRQVYL